MCYLRVKIEYELYGRPLKIWIDDGRKKMRLGWMYRAAKYAHVIHYICKFLAKMILLMCRIASRRAAGARHVASSTP